MSLAETAKKEKSHDWTHTTMFNDLEFRRFLFRCALPIFTAILTKQLAELLNTLFGRGNWYSFAVWCIGFSVTLGLIIRLYRSVVKAPTLSNHKKKGEEKNAKPNINGLIGLMLAWSILADSSHPPRKKRKAPKMRKSVLRKETEASK